MLGKIQGKKEYPHIDASNNRITLILERVELRSYYLYNLSSALIDHSLWILCLIQRYTLIHLEQGNKEGKRRQTILFLEVN